MKVKAEELEKRIDPGNPLGKCLNDIIDDIRDIEARLAEIEAKIPQT